MTVANLAVEAAKLKIKALDLTFIERRLVRFSGYTPGRAAQAVELYRAFLQLHALYPDQSIVPPAAADAAWHEHILYTPRYVRDTEVIFGRYLHHFTDEAMSATYLAAREFTVQAFKEHFGIDIAADGVFVNGGHSAAEDRLSAVCFLPPLPGPEVMAA